MELTLVAYELATSLAPMPQAESRKKRTPTAKSQSRSCIVPAIVASV